MIQDIYPHQYHNEYHPHEPQDTDYVLTYKENTVLLKEDYSFFCVSELNTKENLLYLFEIDDKTFYLGDVSHLSYTPVKIRDLRNLSNQVISFASLTGWQLYNWMKENTYCGCCGSKMENDPKERAMRCPSCNHIVYPRLNPAVIVAVINDKDELLVTKYAHSTYKQYALVAGFAEIGETIEETVKREVKEETGIEVDSITYYKSQPWSLSGSLLFGFWAKVKDSSAITLDENELSLARWITREELKNHLPSPIALTGDMMMKYVKGEHNQ